MSKVVENLLNSSLALCTGQLLVLPLARKPVPEYLENHTDITKPDKSKYLVHTKDNSKTVEPFIEGAEPARKAEIGQDEAELAAETAAPDLDTAKADEDEDKPKSYSVVPPTSPGASEDNNPAYNAGKGVSVVPPPREVQEVRNPKPPVAEPVAEEPVAVKKNKKKGKK